MTNIERFKKFSTRSKAKFSDLLDRIKNDRKWLSSDQWNKADENFVASSRNRITINVIANQVNSVSNSYSAFPFTWYTGEEEIDKKIDEFFGNDSNRFATQEALLDTVSFGLGVLALGSDTDRNGEEIPVIYAVSDVERVLLDPDSVELDGSDAMEGALIDYRSREWVRVHMGSDYVPDEDTKMVIGDAGCSSLIPIITYYWLDTNGCHVTTFVNEREVSDENGVSESVINIHRIPIFPVWGERTWKDDKKTYTGLTSKTTEIQRIINMAFTQLGERLSLSPKPQWEGTLESFKGLDKYYKRAGSGVNPIVPYNRLANDNKTELQPPKRFDNQVQFADVSSIVQNSLNLLPSITGVDSKGLADVESDVTATAVMYTSKVFQNNVRHFFQHLRTSFKSLGDTVLSLMGYNDVNVEVAQGPEEFMELQVARQELSTIIGVVEPSQKRAIVNAILRTHPDNDILAQLYAELNAAPQPTPIEEQAMQTIEQMKQAIDQKDKEILELTAQVDAFQRSREDFKDSLLAEFLKARQAHEFKMEEQAQQVALNQGADAVKAATEADKAQMDLEQKAVQLEAQKVKSATEIMKAVGV